VTSVVLIIGVSLNLTLLGMGAEFALTESPDGFTIFASGFLYNAI
jgi:hypothetical protein